jgi:predicted HTH transcriptional regulator
MTENNRIEFKEELTSDLEKEIVAFLNAKEGGILYIGIDKNGKTVGVADADDLQLRIKDRLKNNILPSCMGLFEVVHESKDGKDIVKVNVASGSEKPYYVKKKGMSEQGCFIRIGSAAEPMPVAMIEELFSKRTRNSLGKIVSNRQDLTFEQLKIYYNTQGFELNKEFLRSIDLYTTEDQFNYVAYLLADNNAVSMKVAKYAGTDKTDLIENVEFGYCSIIKATHSILDKLDIENKTFVKITGAAERLQKQMIDKTALREALINAVVHNDYTSEVPPVVEIYSDRLTITSYGGLVHGLSKEEFFAGRSVPRNRELMRVYRDLRLVEQLGSGINRILKAYDKSIFKLSDNFLEICFPFEPDYESNQDGGVIGGTIKESSGTIEESSGTIGDTISLTDRQKELVNIIKGNSKISSRELANRLNINHSAIQKHLNTLKEKGVIERIGGTRGEWKILIELGR